MNNFRNLILAGLALMAVIGCHPSAKKIGTVTFSNSDSTAHSYLKMDIELPVPDKGPQGQIRRQLIEVLDERLSHIGTYEAERLFPPFDGDPDDQASLMAYYWEQALLQIGTASQADADERARYIREDADFTEEEKQALLADYPSWSFESTLKKTGETERYVVFQSMDYIYMGGAHGGMTGEGDMTFDKQSGQRIRAFVDPGRLEELQPLLREGLLTYFSESDTHFTPADLDDVLMLENGIVPLPSWTPYPGEDGLVFVYQQYEIASYAAGMPSFTVPYDKIRPFLTEEARKILAR